MVLGGEGGFYRRPEAGGLGGREPGIEISNDQDGGSLVLTVAPLPLGKLLQVVLAAFAVLFGHGAVDRSGLTRVPEEFKCAMVRGDFWYSQEQRRFSVSAKCRRSGESATRGSSQPSARCQTLGGARQ